MPQKLKKSGGTPFPYLVIRWCASCCLFFSTQKKRGGGERERERERSIHSKKREVMKERGGYSGPKFTAYNEDVLLVLQSFDKANDWADFIDLLQRLGAVLKRYPQFPEVVPSVLLCGKRLSQCLNPSLPSGVHLKALEMYQLIFSRIGTAGLAKYLHVFASGLFPLFSQASTNVKYALLDIYEAEFLRLQQDLSICLPGFLVAVLPGLEDESSVFHSRTLRLLSKAERRVSRSFFFATLWKSLLLSPSTRLFALQYVHARLPALSEISPTQYQEFFPNSVLLALSCCLKDSNILVQRSGLDLLNLYCQIHTDLYTICDIHWRPLIEAGLLLLLRRENSLTRRIYTWLFRQGRDREEKEGDEEENGERGEEKKRDEMEENRYFEEETKPKLVVTLGHALNSAAFSLLGLSDVNLVDSVERENQPSQRIEKRIVSNDIIGEKEEGRGKREEEGRGGGKSVRRERARSGGGGSLEQSTEVKNITSIFKVLKLITQDHPQQGLSLICALAAPLLNAILSCHLPPPSSPFFPSATFSSRSFLSPKSGERKRAKKGDRGERGGPQPPLRTSAMPFPSIQQAVNSLLEELPSSSSFWDCLISLLSSSPPLIPLSPSLESSVPSVQSPSSCNSNSILSPSPPISSRVSSSTHQIPQESPLLWSGEEDKSYSQLSRFFSPPFYPAPSPSPTPDPPSPLFSRLFSQKSFCSPSRGEAEDYFLWRRGVSFPTCYCVDHSSSSSATQSTLSTSPSTPSSTSSTPQQPTPQTPTTPSRIIKMTTKLLLGTPLSLIESFLGQIYAEYWYSVYESLFPLLDVLFSILLRKELDTDSALIALKLGFKVWRIVRDQTSQSQKTGLLLSKSIRHYFLFFSAYVRAQIIGQLQQHEDEQIENEDVFLFLQKALNIQEMMDSSFMGETRRESLSSPPTRKIDLPLIPLSSNMVLSSEHYRSYLNMLDMSVQFLTGLLAHNNSFQHLQQVERNEAPPSSSLSSSLSLSSSQEEGQKICDSSLSALQSLIVCCFSSDINVSLIGIQGALSLLSFWKVSIEREVGDHNLYHKRGEEKENTQTLLRKNIFHLFKLLWECVRPIGKRLWCLLSPDYEDSHAHVGGLLVQLEEIDPDRSYSFIADEMSAKCLGAKDEALESFRILWGVAGEVEASYKIPHHIHFVNNIFSMFDALSDPTPTTRRIAQNWLLQSLEYPSRFLDPLLSILLLPSSAQFITNQYQTYYDKERILFAFRTLGAILESCDSQSHLSSHLFHGDGRGGQSISSFSSSPHSEGGIGRNALMSRLVVTNASSAIKQLFFNQILYLPAESHIRDSIEDGCAAIGLLPNPQKKRTSSSSVMMYYARCETYADLLVLICIRYLLGHYPDHEQPQQQQKQDYQQQQSDWNKENLAVQAASAELLQSLLLGVDSAQVASRCAASLHSPLLCHLMKLVDEKKEGQDHVLAILRVIVFIDWWKAQVESREKDERGDTGKGGRVYAKEFIKEERRKSDPSNIEGDSVGAEVNPRQNTPSSHPTSASTSTLPPRTKTPSPSRSPSPSSSPSRKKWSTSIPSSPPIQNLSPAEPFPPLSLNPGGWRSLKKVLCGNLLFIDVLQRGICQAASCTNSNLYFFWLQFVVDVLPYLQLYLSSVVSLIIRCLGHLLRTDLIIITSDPSSSLHLQRIIRTVQTLLQVVSFCFGDSSLNPLSSSFNSGLPGGGADGETPKVGGVSGQGGGSSGHGGSLGYRVLSGIVSGMFQATGTAEKEKESPFRKAREKILKYLPFLLETFVELWPLEGTGSSLPRCLCSLRQRSPPPTASSSSTSSSSSLGPSSYQDWDSLPPTPIPRHNIHQIRKRDGETSSSQSLSSSSPFFFPSLSLSLSSANKIHSTILRRQLRELRNRLTSFFSLFVLFRPIYFYHVFCQVWQQPFFALSLEEQLGERERRDLVFSVLLDVLAALERVHQRRGGERGETAGGGEKGGERERGGERGASRGEKGGGERERERENQGAFTLKNLRKLLEMEQPNKKDPMRWNVISLSYISQVEKEDNQKREGEGEVGVHRIVIMDVILSFVQNFNSLLFGSSPFFPSSTLSFSSSMLGFSTQLAKVLDASVGPNPVLATPPLPSALTCLRFYYALNTINSFVSLLFPLSGKKSSPSKEMPLSREFIDIVHRVIEICGTLSSRFHEIIVQNEKLCGEISLIEGEKKEKDDLVLDVGKKLKAGVSPFLVLEKEGEVKEKKNSVETSLLLLRMLQLCGGKLFRCVFGENQERIMSILGGLIPSLLPHFHIANVKIDSKTNTNQTNTTNATNSSALPNTITNGSDEKRNPKTTEENEGEVIALVSSLCDFPHMFEPWRAPLGELFFEESFFGVHRSSSSIFHWGKVIDRLISRDRTAFLEVISRKFSKAQFVQAPSGAKGESLSQYTYALTPSQQDSLSRFHQMRRLAFVLFAGERDQHISRLALIQEKIVETLKLRLDPAVYCEIFLVLRVLLIRFSPARLRSYWPIILTEMYQIFSSEDPQLDHVVYAAWRFVDLAMTLSAELFAQYEWIFLVDKMVTRPLSISSELNREQQGSTSAFTPFLDSFLSSRYAPGGVSVVTGAKSSPLGEDGMEGFKKSTKEKRRPFLNQVRMRSFEDLLETLQSYSEYLSSLPPSNNVASVDQSFINNGFAEEFGQPMSGLMGLDEATNSILSRAFQAPTALLQTVAALGTGRES